MSNTVLISVRQTTSITRFSPSRLSAALALPTSRSAVKYGLSGLGGRDVRTVIWGRAGGNRRWRARRSTSLRSVCINQYERMLCRQKKYVAFLHSGQCSQVLPVSRSKSKFRVQPEIAPNICFFTLSRISLQGIDRRLNHYNPAYALS
jgi:hypothetical protein